MREILGDYAGVSNFESFLANDKGADVRAQEAVGKLQGRRFALASETANNRRFSEALIKQLTGGDTLIGAKIHASSWEFEPTHKNVFLANHLPAIKDATVAMWGRVRVIPFNKEYLGGNRDLQLREKLMLEREGIFAWLVAGARKYLETGTLPKIPQACIAATRAYRDQNDL